MSLVNDMLRDLDQRRQEPVRSGIGFGAERLVPVPAEEKGDGVNRSLVTFILSILITLAVIVGALYFWQSMRVTAPEAVPIQPAFSPAPVATTVPAVDQRELEEITERMRQLEEQNRALLEARTAIPTDSQVVQQAIVTQPPVSVANEIVSEPVAEEIASTESAVAQQAEALTSTDPVGESSPQSIPSPTAVEPSVVADASASIRSPRTLSFPERDLLQVQEAQRLAASNQSDLAMQQLQAFVMDNPNAHESREAMVKLALQKSDSDRAEALLQEGMAIDAMRPGYRKLQARLLLGSGRAEEALQLLGSRIPTIAVDVEYHDILATAYLSMQDFDNAAKSYEALVQQNRAEGRWWYGLAYSWESLGRQRDARLAYEEALKLPNLSAALRQRSQQRIAEMGL